jgi:quinoprotein relay system zinc metallohydrolase 1
MKIRLLILLLITSLPVVGGERDYGLHPRQVADGTYVLVGRNEHFDFHNGGNIVNTAFIVTPKGVIVIDTGPSRRYGEQLRKAIGQVTRQPIVQVYITHLHPDHFLGNQAFEDLPIAALEATREGIRQLGEGFSDNLYRLVGSWMSGTRVVVPNRTAEPGTVEIGGHHLRLIALEGHTGADLALLDETTGVLFAGDLVFHDRTPTTPHAHIDRWLNSLGELREIDYRLLVPGHGEPVAGTAAIAQTADYLNWLESHLTEAAESGAAMAELLHPSAPAGVRELAVFDDEYQRSLSHLYPALEEAALARGLVEPVE